MTHVSSPIDLREKEWVKCDGCGDIAPSGMSNVYDEWLWIGHACCVECAEMIK